MHAPLERVGRSGKTPDISFCRALAHLHAIRSRAYNPMFPSLVLAARHSRARSPLATSPVKTARTGRSRARGREIGVAPVLVRAPTRNGVRAPTSRLPCSVRLTRNIVERGPSPDEARAMVGPAGTGAGSGAAVTEGT